MTEGSVGKQPDAQPDGCETLEAAELATTVYDRTHGFVALCREGSDALTRWKRMK